MKLQKKAWSFLLCKGIYLDGSAFLPFSANGFYEQPLGFVQDVFVPADFRPGAIDQGGVYLKTSKKKENLKQETEKELFSVLKINCYRKFWKKLLKLIK